MTGYVIAMGPCATCGRLFSFNPHKVPSVRVKGEREPICQPCMDFFISREEAAGLTPKRYAPDAYEAIPESEL